MIVTPFFNVATTQMCIDLDDLLITRGKRELLGMKEVCYSIKKGIQGVMILK